MKRKDALTDIVEHAQDAEFTEPMLSISGERQVVNAQGEIITLGQKPPINVAASNKAVSLELSEVDLVDWIRASFKSAATRFLQKREQNKGV
jgi:hypothetical protein